MEFRYDVFLSHNSKDKPKVRRLAERLKAAGLRIWFDEWNIRSGDIIALKVDEGLELSRVLLLCVSPNALASGWVALERSTAIHRDPSNEDRRFIPLLLAECELPDTLRRYKYLDYREETDQSLGEVLAACKPDFSTVSDLRMPPAEKVKAEKIGKQQPKPASESRELAVFEYEMSGRTGDKGWIRSIAISQDGSLAAVGDDDAKVALWHIQDKRKIKVLTGHTDGVTSVVVSPDGKQVVSGTRDGVIRLWDSQSGNVVRERKLAQPFIVTALGALSSFDKILCVGACQQDNVLLWDAKKDDVDWSFRLKNNKYVECCAISPDEQWALLGKSDGDIDLIRLEDGVCTTSMKGHSEKVNSIKIAPDGERAISGSRDNTIKVWNLRAGTCIGTLEGHQQLVSAVSLTQDGRYAASSGFTDNSVRLWDLKSGTCIQVIKLKRGMIPWFVTFEPSGDRLVIGMTDGEILVYKIKQARYEPVLLAPRRYMNAKVVLLGEGTVGKTSLAHRLIEDRYVVHDRTHGMNVWRMELPLSQHAEFEREALLWDLAGQEDYRLIHQLFLDETALALLLVNPQRSDPFAEAGDWLKALKTVAGHHASKREAAKLLVFSQVDVGSMKLGDAKIDRFVEQHGFADWLWTSAKTGDNCSDGKSGGQPSKLKRAIADAIPWNELPWTSTPRLLAELKSAVMAMRDERDIRLLRFAELAQRLEQALPDERFGEAEVRTAVTLLANHGLVRPLKFGDLVLLQPELINGYAGSIIRAARSHIDEIGAVREEDIYRDDFDFTGVKRLNHRPDEVLLLHAIVQTLLDHALCSAEDMPGGRHLVFPSQYRREKDLPRDPEIFVSYTFSGEWQTVWTTLVVRLWLSQEFEHRELWRNATEFVSPKGHVLGMKIDNRQGEGTATIGLYFDREVPDELKVIFIEYVHRHLIRYGCEVSRERRYVCTACATPVRDHDAVRKRVAAGKRFIVCQVCDEEVQLLDFIERRLDSDKVARRVYEMDAEASRQLDTQALEQILIGHMMAVTGEANQIFRPVTMFDHGIDGEVEFKDDNGKASGKRVYIQLKSGNSYLRKRKRDGSEVFDVKDERHLEYWVSQPVDVYLVIRQTDEMTREQFIRWMNVTAYLKARRNKTSKQIVFEGEKLDVNAIWSVRDRFFPAKATRQK